MQPPVTDHRAIIDAVRRYGSVHYLKTAVPGEFTVWRRSLRQFARRGNLHISVIRTSEFVVVENREYEVSDEDSLATTDVIGAQLLGQDLTFAEAVNARRRLRMRLVDLPDDGLEDDAK